MSIFGNDSQNRDIVVVGASAGGVEVLQNFVSQFPTGFPAAIFIVMHIPPEYPSLLPKILGRNTDLPVVHPVDGDKIINGQIYVAPSDLHLMVDDGLVRLSRGPRENHFRPAIDVLFRSAARGYGRRVTGVVLTGVLDDGSAGLYAIKSRGGMAVVQDPNDAPYPDMPRNAMKVVEVDHCLPLAAMGSLISGLVKESVQDNTQSPTAEMDLEVNIALDYNAIEHGVMQLGEPTSYTCPECHGSLAQIVEGKVTRFRCHTGHAFSLNTLLVEVTKSIDSSLWDTLRTIEESQLLMCHIADHLKAVDQGDDAALVIKKSEEAKERATAIRKLVLNNQILSQEKMSSDT